MWIKNGISIDGMNGQAATYTALLEVLLNKRYNGKVGWNLWHIDDAHGWHKEWYPSLFDINYNPKPAYYAIYELLDTKSNLIQ